METMAVVELHIILPQAVRPLEFRPSDDFAYLQQL